METRFQPHLFDYAHVNIHRLVRIKLLEAISESPSRPISTSTSRKKYGNERRSLYITKLRESRRAHKKECTDCNSFDIKAFTSATGKQEHVVFDPFFVHGGPLIQPSAAAKLQVSKTDGS